MEKYPKSCFNYRWVGNHGKFEQFPAIVMVLWTTPFSTNDESCFQPHIELVWARVMVRWHLKVPPQCTEPSTVHRKQELLRSNTISYLTTECSTEKEINKLVNSRQPWIVHALTGFRFIAESRSQQSKPKVGVSKRHEPLQVVYILRQRRAFTCSLSSQKKWKSSERFVFFSEVLKKRCHHHRRHTFGSVKI